MIEKAQIKDTILGLLRSANFHGIHPFIYCLSHPRDFHVTPRDQPEIQS